MAQANAKPLAPKVEHQLIALNKQPSALNKQPSIFSTRDVYNDTEFCRFSFSKISAMIQSLTELAGEVELLSLFERGNV